MLDHLSTLLLLLVLLWLLYFNCISSFICSCISFKCLCWLKLTPFLRHIHTLLYRIPLLLRRWNHRIPLRLLHRFPLLKRRLNRFPMLTQHLHRTSPLTLTALAVINSTITSVMISEHNCWAILWYCTSIIAIIIVRSYYLFFPSTLPLPHGFFEHTVIIHLLPCKPIFFFKLQALSNKLLDRLCYDIPWLSYCCESQWIAEHIIHQINYWITRPRCVSID